MQAGTAMEILVFVVYPVTEEKVQVVVELSTVEHQPVEGMPMAMVAAAMKPTAEVGVRKSVAMILGLPVELK